MTVNSKENTLLELDLKLKVKQVRNEKVANLSRRQTSLVFSIPTLPEESDRGENNYCPDNLNSSG